MALLIGIIIKNMSVDFCDTLVIGISSRTLFDLEEENKVFESEGIKEYRKWQKEKENETLKPGTSYYLVQALLALNKLSTTGRLVEVIVMSKNSAETGVRVLNSIKSLQLDITRSVFSGGESLSPYMDAFQVDLFLSKNEKDVQEVIDSKIAAAALICEPPTDYTPEKNTVRIAFDADAVIFSDESEQIYKSQGLAKFYENEEEKENIPMQEGPHSKLLKMLSTIQGKMNTDVEESPLKIAIITARNSPAHMRVIKTLRAWEIYIDQIFFLGGMSKGPVLKAFNAHIFFDDQDAHLDGTKHFVPSGKVPYESKSELNK